MRTLIIIIGGFLLLGLALLIARLIGGPGKKPSVRAARIFLPVWLAVASFNLWMGVAHAGYAFRDEFPIFLASSASRPSQPVLHGERLPPNHPPLLLNPIFRFHEKNQCA